jgi:hypothetical protein
MAGLMRTESPGQAACVSGRFDRLFDGRLRMMPLRPMGSRARLRPGQENQIPIPNAPAGEVADESRR